MTAPSQFEPPDELSRRLTLALATAPAVEISADFAARTVLAATALAVPTPSVRFSKLAIQCAFAMLLLAMLLFAARSHTLSTAAMAVELLLALELAALSTWLSLRSRR